jgi:hypothetical protein
MTTMREDFEMWLFDMDDALDRFINAMPNELGFSLDFSEASLDHIENWLLDQYKDHTKLLEIDNKEIHDGLSRYIGETFRKHLNAKWDIRFDDPKFAFYGLPILVEKENGNTIICAHTLVTTAVARRTGTFLSTILRNNIKRLGTRSS